MVKSLSFPSVAAGVSPAKRLHLAPVRGLGFGLIEDLRAWRPLIRCEAYEADRSEPVESEVVAEGRSEAAKRAKIGLYFATWWALNVVFNIYNKKVLNAFPYPWLTSTLSLATGSLMMLISWATRIAETPKTDFEFWKTLFPVSIEVISIFGCLKDGVSTGKGLCLMGW